MIPKEKYIDCDGAKVVIGSVISDYHDLMDIVRLLTFVKSERMVRMNDSRGTAAIRVEDYEEWLALGMPEGPHSAI